MDVAVVVDQIANLQILNQFLLSLFLLIPMVLVARTAVAGTRYSPILIIVLFGLTMGYVLVASGVSSPGLPQFSLIDLVSRTTIVALTVSFFVGGQELRKIVGNIKLDPDDMVVPSTEETVLGTGRTQLIFIIRSFFLLIGIEALYRLILGLSFSDLSRFYPVIAYLGLVGAVIMIDYKAKVANKRRYIKMGLAEVIAILGILLASYGIALWIRPFIALPQIFFAMILSAGLGALMYRWRFGPTIRALLFAGIPVVLAANFMIGGSRINDAFAITGMNAVLAYGFFGQVFWMFGGIALLMLFGRTDHARNLAPGMAGALSHSGLTGACTAGDLGDTAAYRAPIMINVPFFGHIFVFSILAMSAQQGALILWPSLFIVLGGIVLTIVSLRSMSRADNIDAREVKGLMQFSFGWQLCAVFGGFILMSLAGMPLGFTAMAVSSGISHFGLFAATQGGMFGPEASALIPFIFSMPFLVHPLVFFMFGRAMERQGVMPKTPVYILAAIGLVGILYAMRAA
ncbi:hypothetical protein [Desulfatitalea alkaliphila]|uniref:Uncharacterized protein n=1 Tax=Desulfatitalea alkaliphila TaxID=2929485 RepID=A0AA41R2Z4_9BACT|nr:hypothetical protein [Desulfatitalea alkaliphila]MCJ8499766.1 hypothetical protein [Desulfatitalea alkaliphila]